MNKPKDHSHKRQFKEVIFIAATLCLVASRANAYIDPATGLVAWQAILAVVGGLLIFLRNPIKFIKDIFFRIRNRKKSR